uniref:Uncharacterized protein n=1 Tax=Peronospora matthiolae TaxID=2874970 RepID=A0AAV1T9G8_9STRA
MFGPVQTTVCLNADWSLVNESCPTSVRGAYSQPAPVFALAYDRSRTAAATIPEVL